MTLMKAYALSMMTMTADALTMLMMTMRATVRTLPHRAPLKVSSFDFDVLLFSIFSQILLLLFVVVVVVVVLVVVVVVYVVVFAIVVDVEVVFANLKWKLMSEASMEQIRERKSTMIMTIMMSLI